MLKIIDIHKTYANGVHALHNINLEIPHGLFGLLGPNGAGKSSLMRTLATLQEPDSGSIQFNGLDVLQNQHQLRKMLGYLPQDFGLYPKVSAEELLSHFAVLKGLQNSSERKESVEYLLHQTNLWNVRKHHLGTFSGGMRQRFGIAQALLGSPQLVIVDEPTAGLDPDERNRFLNLLAEIGEQAVVILSTHIVADVTALCPRMAMMINGHIVTQGEPDTIISTIKHKIWSAKIHKNALSEYQEQYLVLSHRFIGGKLQIHVYADVQPNDSFIPVEPDLEDVYFFKLHQFQSSMRRIDI